MAGEYPLAHHEMSILLPHFLKEGRGRIDTYFTRVYNPVWTNPDGFSWLEVLTDESLVGCHVALTPTWSETAWFADYVLPMGVAAERHDLAQLRDPRRALDRLPPAGAARQRRARGTARRAHLRGQPGRGVGGERVLDRPVVAHRPGRLARHPPALRVDRPPRRAARRSTSTTTTLFRDSVPGLPGGGRGRGLDAAGVHAPARRVRDPRRPARGARDAGAADELDRAGAVRDDDGVYRVPGTAGPHDSLDEIQRPHAVHRRRLGRRRRRRRAVRVGFPTPSRKLELYSRRAARLGLARARHARRSSRATSTGRTSTSTAASGSWCRRSASRR